MRPVSNLLKRKSKIKILEKLWSRWWINTSREPFLRFLSSGSRMRCGPATCHKCSCKKGWQFWTENDSGLWDYHTLTPKWEQCTWRSRWSSSALQLLLFMHMWRYVRHLWDSHKDTGTDSSHPILHTTSSFTHCFVSYYWYPGENSLILNCSWWGGKKPYWYLFLHSRGVFFCIFDEIMCHLFFHKP